MAKQPLTLSDIGPLEKVLNYSFKTKDILRQALHHPSATTRSKADKRPGKPGKAKICPQFERYEFLGDRVLGLIIADMLVQNFPDEAEGALAKRHAALVRRETLVEIAEQICLSDYMTAGMNKFHGPERESILADGCEAVIAACYLDGGLSPAFAFVQKYWMPLLNRDISPPNDAKTDLQERAQQEGKPLPVYEVMQQSGPAHNPEFIMRVLVQGWPTGNGVGRSKRTAQRMAAEDLLRQLENSGIQKL